MANDISGVGRNGRKDTLLMPLAESISAQRRENLSGAYGARRSLSSLRISGVRGTVL